MGFQVLKIFSPTFSRSKIDLKVPLSRSTIEMLCLGERSKGRDEDFICLTFELGTVLSECSLVLSYLDCEGF